MSAFSRLKASGEIKTAIELIRACVGMGKGQWNSLNRTVSLLVFSLQVRVYFATLPICFSLFALVSIKDPSLYFQVRHLKVHKSMYASFIKE